MNFGIICPSMLGDICQGFLADMEKGSSILSWEINQAIFRSDQ